MNDLTEEAKAELRSLTIRQVGIVEDGLKRKLAHLDKTGHLSYRYDVCPVCEDVGSTEEDSSACQGCYIRKACRAPFDFGFRDDQERGEKYFRDMYDFLGKERPMTALVVGGRWTERGGRPSKIAGAIADYLGADSLIGGHYHHLKEIDISAYGLVVWMPDIPNEHPKVYPSKGRGAVLVVSKVMREGVTEADAAARIFRMHGNAVIEIHGTPEDGLRFRLADALNNPWADTSDVEHLCGGILRLAQWTVGSKRLSSQRADVVLKVDDDMEPALGSLVGCARVVADRVEAEMGGRYFGNLSTRCMKMFPSAGKVGDDGVVAAYVSPRNVDKRRIEADDMVAVAQGRSGDPVLFYNDSKPSVDAPVQLELYRIFPEIRFMIHGHAYIEGAPFTKEYFPCGDLREVIGAAFAIDYLGEGFVNLKNHGFLLFAKSVESMEDLVRGAVFQNRL